MHIVPAADPPASPSGKIHYPLPEPIAYADEDRAGEGEAEETALTANAQQYDPSLVVACLSDNHKGPTGEVLAQLCGQARYGGQYYSGQYFIRE